MSQKSFHKKIRVQFDIEVSDHDMKTSSLVITNVRFQPFEVSSIILVFGTMQFLHWLVETTPEELLKKGSQAEALFNQIRHFATYIEREDFIKPL